MRAQERVRVVADRRQGRAAVRVQELARVEAQGQVRVEFLARVAAREQGQAQVEAQELVEAEVVVRDQSRWKMAVRYEECLQTLKLLETQGEERVRVPVRK